MDLRLYVDTSTHKRAHALSLPADDMNLIYKL